MKSLLKAIFTIFIISSSANAQEPICGRVTGAAFNQDTLERPYSLSGFWIKQNTRDIRVTFGNSPLVIETVEDYIQEGGLFICLDEYTLKTQTYARKPRVYASSNSFRLWQKGQRLY